MSPCEVIGIAVGYIRFRSPPFVVHVYVAVVLEAFRIPYTALVPCTGFATLEEWYWILYLCPMYEVIGVSYVEAVREVNLAVAALIGHKPFVDIFKTENSGAVD